MNLSESQNKSALPLTVPAPQLSRLDKIYAKPVRNFWNSLNNFLLRHETTCMKCYISNILVITGLETLLSAWILA